MKSAGVRIIEKAGIRIGDTIKNRTKDETKTVLLTKYPVVDVYNQIW